MLRYTVLLHPAEPDEEPGFSVFVPALPGCFSQGDSFEEALEHIREAIQLHLEGMLEDGEEIPIESRPYIQVPVEVPEPAALKAKASKRRLSA
ncbi:MAG TPA: type II toxin-antitoxin system HicB family antitoxin [Dehalococcoidia bacterium]|nr:type II toxin-antitoxin system HicB family antitoxin [Dehalococcoidia bacterium]